MAAKRHLGLAKAGKAKKLKTVTPVPDSLAASHPQDDSDGKRNGADSTEAQSSVQGDALETGDSISVEINDDVDANDAMGQLKALWRNFITSDERNELMVNAIVHECDRMLRKHEKIKNGTIDEEKIVLKGDFYSIYALALSSLAFFHTETPEQVKEYFEAAEERIDVGKQTFPDSVSLLFAEARILINKIPLTEISQLTVESRINREHKDVSIILDKCLQVWENAEMKTIEKKEFEYFNRENSDFLEALDDLLEMVHNFGRDTMEGDDSEDEEEPEEVVLNEKHPLSGIHNTKKYTNWWKQHTQKFLDNLSINLQETKEHDDNDMKTLVALKRDLNKRLGVSFLVEAEEPNSVFTKLAYYSEGEFEINGMTLIEAQKVCKKLYSKALECLRAAEDADEPDSWASVAEAIISLGNVYDVDSEEQERLYKEAEAILVRANNVTNGKYETILENLMQESN